MASNKNLRDEFIPLIYVRQSQYNGVAYYLKKNRQVVLLLEALYAIMAGVRTTNTIVLDHSKAKLNKLKRSAPRVRRNRK